MLRAWLAFLLFVLLGLPVSAQPLTVVAPPTSAHRLTWSDSQTIPVDRYEVRYRAADAWASVGKPAGNAVALPDLVDGSYLAEVRACNAGGCGASASAAFIVQTPPPPTPNPVTGVTIVANQPSTPPPVVTPPPVNPPPVAAALFSDGWDRNGVPGCDFAKLSDNSAWQDYGPAGTCSGAPVAEVVTDEKVDGIAALRVNFRPDGSGNGPDFRIVRTLGQQSEVYARWYTKWSANWVWAGADHKVAIFGAGNQSTQDVYYNIRGNGGGGPAGRVTIHVIPMDVAFSDPDVVVTPGVWHLCELHIVSGPNGRVEAKIDGVRLNLRAEAGNLSANPNSLNTGTSVGYVKLDTTYNVYSYPSSRGLTMAMWYDAVSVAAGRGTF